MLKARGILGFEKVVDNIFHCANYLSDAIEARDDFRLVIRNTESPSVCFWYIPKHLQKSGENTDEFWKIIDLTTKTIISRLARSGKQMIGYSNLPKYHSTNFFRVALVGYPNPTEHSMNAILNDIAEVGKDL